ncbi:hypothetical protein M436DRAFT_44419 [Aureobasidium namibiae CBS 147.97]|uniref:Uncharacterized protein n=1 Tax=Aureobasidium namibiae CBS 147.97 TaxID=1043004 RepID=A0A074XIW4_9PEZI|nr:uncharacterized protein M436DRAFT_44419 [Aureobasidium namibiae CBS 147.97]KEQ74496.1 hypothetical protein M436DRAFT_44419 [Aureobasidium namibiae CBS 147.97]
MVNMTKRALESTGASEKTKAAIVVGSVGAVLLFSIILFFVLRSIRLPKNIRQAQAAARAHARSRKPRRSWIQTLTSPFRRNDSQTPASAAREMIQDPEAAVNRHTSIRSIATLPAYSAVPLENEGVLGREGERAGMDTVVEFPETNEEEEGRREAEMASLWQIRQQRRQEAAEREDRRRRRREARARGDMEALSALRHETALRVTLERANGSNSMVAEHNARPRERRISAVSYGDLGVARHDGSRVRANSTESDSRPLLNDASRTGSANPLRPWLSRGSFSTHHRVASATSVLTADSADPDDSDFEVISLQHTSSRPRSSLAVSRAHSINLSLRRTSTTQVNQLQRVESDLGESRMPLPELPRYDDAMGSEEAPPYEEIHSSRPSLSRANSQTRPSLSRTNSQTRPSENSSPLSSLPEIVRLPSIRINEASPTESPRQFNFPANTRPMTASTIDEETSHTT